MHRRLVSAGLCAVLLLAAGAAASAEPSRQAQVKARIRHLVQTQAPGARVSVGPLGALSQMSPCPSTVQMQLYGRGRYRNVRLSCPEQGWQLYVPVSVRSLRKIAVAAHDLPAGVALTRADIKLVRPRLAPAYQGGLVHDPGSVVGHVLRAPISAGSPINLSSLAEAVRIHAGQSVTVHVRAGAVEIRTTAIALQDGRVGQSILVKNPDSGHRYRVQVTAHGVIDDLSG